MGVAAVTAVYATGFRAGMRPRGPSAAPGVWSNRGNAPGQPHLAGTPNGTYSDTRAGTTGGIR